MLIASTVVGVLVWRDRVLTEQEEIHNRNEMLQRDHDFIISELANRRRTDFDAWDFSAEHMVLSDGITSFAWDYVARRGAAQCIVAALVAHADDQDRTIVRCNLQLVILMHERHCEATINLKQPSPVQINDISAFSAAYQAGKFEREAALFPMNGHIVKETLELIFKIANVSTPVMRNTGSSDL